VFEHHFTLILHILHSMTSKTYTIDTVIGLQKKIPHSNCKQIWEEFVKWAFFQFESERHISFGQIGDYGYKID
jgi:hypothetical protein